MLVPLRRRRQRPDPPLAEVQVAEEEGLLGSPRWSSPDRVGPESRSENKFLRVLLRIYLVQGHSSR